MRTVRCLAALVFATGLALSVQLSGAAADGQGPDRSAIDAAREEAAAKDGMANLSAEEQEMVGSAEPKVIEMDIETGVILSVERDAKVGDGQVQPADVVPGGVCYGPPPQACYQAQQISGNVQFTGTGIDYGTWAGRKGYASGPYDADACWRIGSGGNICSTETVGPNSNVAFNGLVTGTSHIRS